MLVTNNNLHQRHELKYYVLDHNEAMSFMDAAVVKENCFVYKCYEKYILGCSFHLTDQSDQEIALTINLSLDHHNFGISGFLRRCV